MRLSDLFKRATHAAELALAIGKSIGAKPREPAAPLPRAEARNYTRSEFATYDGRDPTKPILLAIRGKVYDVTRGRSFYGPGGPYAAFAGHECARALALDSLEAEDVRGDLDDLSAAKLQRLDEWVDTFELKYGALGELVDG